MKAVPIGQVTRPFIEEVCDCGRVWRGRVAPALGCEECYPVDEDAFEEFEHERRRKIAERNEF